jgi:hypothetical protein
MTVLPTQAQSASGMDGSRPCSNWATRMLPRPRRGALDVADRHAPERLLEDGSATDLLLFGLAGTLEFSMHVREQSGGVAVLQ